jgi:hypothetical protein
MRTFARFGMVAGLAAVLAVGGVTAQEPPKPQKEHEWLKRLEGEWTTECEAVMEPGKPAVKSKGTETTRSLGGLWTVAELKNDFQGVAMTGLMTVGYDPVKKKYVGTYVCSMCDHLFEYVGTVDGQTLTLECDGPNPADPAKKVRMKDVIEVKDKDHKELRSYMRGEDGKWVQFMTMTATRKK